MTLFKKLERSYEFKWDWHEIRDEIDWLGDDKKGIAVQHSKYCKDVYHDRLVKVKHLKGEEHEYNIINPLFKDTIFEQILRNYDGYGARILSMSPMTMYSSHMDPMPRLHLVLETNPFCFMLFPEHKKMYHIPEDNNVYYVNTSEIHTMVNTAKPGFADRIHFVFMSDYLNEQFDWVSKWTPNIKEAMYNSYK